MATKVATLRSVRGDDTCEEYHVDEAKVRKIVATLRRGERFEGVARIFQVLSDPTRVKLLYALAQDELCVCDLAVLVGRSRPAVSHQLRVLRDLRLVQYRRQGKMAFYRLVDDHVRSLVLDGLQHAEGD